MTDSMIKITSRGTTFLYGNEDFVVASPEEVKNKLEEVGVASLADVLSAEECKAMNSGMWDTVEFLTSGLKTPVNRNNPKTYKHLWSLNPLHGGLFQHFGWGHAQYVWDVRQNPAVATTFTKLYDCEMQNLLVSFDGANASLGALIPGTSRKGQFQGRHWLHVDQRYSNNSFQCVQSWVTANDILPGDATLRFLSGSHKFHKEFAETFGLTEHNADWYKLEPDKIQWYKDRGCVDTCITAKAGTQVFWDSRTVHSGIEPIPMQDCPKRNKPRKPRNVVYACYQPREPVSIAMRSKILDPNHEYHLRMTSHWPNKMKLFPQYPRAYGPPPEGCRQTDPNSYWSFVPKLPHPRLTILGRRFAGLEDDC